MIVSTNVSKNVALGDWEVEKENGKSQSPLANGQATALINVKNSKVSLKMYIFMR